MFLHHAALVCPTQNCSVSQYTLITESSDLLAVSLEACPPSQPRQPGVSQRYTHAPRHTPTHTHMHTHTHTHTHTNTHTHKHTHTYKHADKHAHGTMSSLC